MSHRLPVVRLAQRLGEFEGVFSGMIAVGGYQRDPGSEMSIPSEILCQDAILEPVAQESQWSGTIRVRSYNYRRVLASENKFAKYDLRNPLAVNLYC